MLIRIFEKKEYKSDHRWAKTPKEKLRKRFKLWTSLSEMFKELGQDKTETREQSESKQGMIKEWRLIEES